MQELSSQICATHIELIDMMARALANPEARDEADFLIAQYREDGWTDLCNTLTAWLDGTQPNSADLDEEDAQIVGGIQRAGKDPSWLASLADEAREQAAINIAALIYAGTWGDHDALGALSQMREAAHAAGMKDSAADAFVAIVEGERDLDTLVRNHPQADPVLIQSVHGHFQTLEAEAD